MSVQYTPEQNGISERANRTLCESARCMLLQGNLPIGLWAEILKTAAHIRNRCVSRSSKGKTPIEIWSGKKPTVNYFRTIGSKTFVLKNPQKREKFETSSEEMILIGYSDTSKAYNLWKPGTKSVTKARNVKIIEPEEIIVNTKNEINNKKELESKFITLTYPENTLVEKTNIQEVIDFPLENYEIEAEVPLENQELQANIQDNVEIPLEYDELEAEIQDDKNVSIENNVLNTNMSSYNLRNKENIHKPKRYEDEVFNIASNIEDPIDIQEALSGKNHEEWRKAIASEYNSLKENNTWELVTLPKGRKSIPCKWVLNTKYKADGSIERRKARLVAKGCAQIFGKDFKESFSPVVRHSSIRTLIAIAAEKDLEIHHIDVSTAFLNGSLSEEVYMQQPECFVKKGEESKVCLLNKSLYGLKQAGYEWNKKLNKVFFSLNFKKSKADECVYFKKTKNSILYLAVYVDDILLFGKKDKIVEEKIAIGKIFKIRDLGKAKYILGIEIKDSKDSYEMVQTKYINDILHNFRMQDAKPAHTPLELKINLSEIPESEYLNEKIDSKMYQSLIGSLMYLSTSTRPDISYAVSQLSKFFKEPKRYHWQVGKRVLRYLKETQNVGLKFVKSGGDLIGYADADWGNDLNDRKSVSGYCFLLAGGCISWQAKKQNLVALSTTEAEYISLAEATKECIYLRSLLCEIGYCDIINKPTIIFNDNNQSTISLVNNPSSSHSRTKHIAIKYHFVKDTIQKKEIMIIYKCTEEMTADILTKSLSLPKHTNCIRGLNLRNINY